MRHVVLVGATDGIGLALAGAYLERSWRVGLVGRKAAKVREKVEELREGYPGSTVVGGVLDVTQRKAVRPALDAVLAELGQMDLLVYSAGVLERASSAHRMMAVNLTGAVDVLRWGAEYFRDAGGGHLAALGSVAGDRGRSGNPAYNASKAGLHAWLEGMRSRLHAEDVRVTTVKPGWVDTRMLGQVPKFPPTASPERAARAIVRGLERGREVFYVPWWWEVVSLAVRMTPRAIFKRVGPG